MSPTQFAHRVAEEMGVADDPKKRDNAIRTAKRWLSKAKLDVELRLPPPNRAVAARVVGLPEGRLLPRPAPVPGDLLEELAGKVADALEDQAKMRRQIAALRARVKALEDLRVPVEAAPKETRTKQAV